MTLSPPLSLYVHIPWCIRKCPYCDFNSHEKKLDFDEETYTKALLLDLEQAHKIAEQKKLVSIFFGGGTPSLFTAKSIARIITRASELFSTDGIEITLEANPGTFEQEKFSAYRDAGVNRLSIGIQSFNTDFLLSLGRIHNGEQAIKAIETARRAGFENINLDLMSGLPRQSIEQAIEDVNIACQQNINHISHYQLTIEPNTYFHKHTPSLPEEDLLWAMQTECQQQLSRENYQQYEVSAYSKVGKQSRHNLNYWLFGDYIGIGAGAHSKLTNTQTQTIIRQWKTRKPATYMENSINSNCISGENIPGSDDIAFEFLLNVLRLKQGCKTDILNQNTGLDIKQLQHTCKDISSELLVINNEKICTTDKGFLFLNEILERLL